MIVALGMADGHASPIADACLICCVTPPSSSLLISSRPIIRSLFLSVSSLPSPLLAIRRFPRFPALLFGCSVGNAESALPSDWRAARYQRDDTQGDQTGFIIYLVPRRRPGWKSATKEMICRWVRQRCIISLMSLHGNLEEVSPRVWGNRRAVWGG